MHLELTGAEVRGLYSGQGRTSYSDAVALTFFGVLEAIEAASSDGELRSLKSIVTRDQMDDRFSIELAEGYGLQLKRSRHPDGSACVHVERIVGPTRG